MAPPTAAKKKLKKVQDVKLKKVQEMRTDTPAMLEALDVLASFYGPKDNTLDARRNLRFDLEERGLGLVEEFLAEFEPIQQRIDTLNDKLARVHAVCDGLAAQLDASAEDTGRFAEATKALASRRDQVAERAKIMDNFLHRFRLSDQQMSALSEGPRDDDGGALFFSALEDVQRIRGECEALISSQFQSAGLELFDAMANFQEQAYEQLYGWVQSQCVTIDAEFPEPSEALQRGIATLAEAPAYFDHARDCVAETRAASMARRFAVALTQGGASGNPRPIEMHAHDPMRYIGDMLAWVHQNMAVEKSLITKLFPAGLAPPAAAAAASQAPPPPLDENARAAQPETKSAEERNAETLDKIFEGAMPPLMGRVRQVLESGIPLVLSFKLSNLLEFYRETLAAVLGSDKGLALDTVDTLHREALAAFFATVRAQSGKLLASPPAYPRDLSVALEVSELLRRLAEVLAVHNDALSSTTTGAAPAEERQAKFLPVLDAFIQPLLVACRQSASGLDRSDAAVYIINNLVAVQGSLTRYDFTVDWVQRLTEEIGDWTDLLVKEQSEAILRRSGMSEKIESVQRCDPSAPLASQPGMDIDSLKQVLGGFYKSMFSLVMPEFDRLVSPRLRASARNATSQAVAAAYEGLYNALVDEQKSGFSRAQLEDVLLHDPQQVRQLLDA